MPLPAPIESLLPVPTGPLRVAADAAIELSVIIPTFNEKENIAALVEQLTRILDAELGDRYELIVVDDNSPHQTSKKALRLTAAYPCLRVMQRKFERGLTAVIRGLQAARGRVLGAIDADLQHPPEVIAKLWREMSRGADLAVASRHVEGGGVSDWRLSRRILSRGAQVLGVILMPGVVGRVSDPMSGSLRLRRSAIADSVMCPVGYKILIEVLARGRIRWISEVGYVFRERTEGKSKVTARVYVDYLVHLIRLRLEFLRSSRFVRFWPGWPQRSRCGHVGALRAQRSGHARLGADAQQTARCRNLPSSTISFGMMPGPSATWLRTSAPCAKSCGVWRNSTWSAESAWR